VIYARVEGVTDDQIDCTDLDTGLKFTVSGLRLIDQFIAADLFTKIVKVTRTQLAQHLVSAGVKPFTVGFIKADGSERTLRGKLVDHEDLLGRSMVRDFDITEGDALRQVDHRTIQWLIVGDVRYELKGGSSGADTA